MQYHFIILKEANLKSNNIKDINNVKKWLKLFGENLAMMKNTDENICFLPPSNITSMYLP